MANLSPMMQQYLAVKEKHKDHIVFFRVGDFYEMFFDDAILASEELELTLTGKDCGLPERAPMCGVPYHACETYIQKLLEKGHKVAICEQTEEPTKGKTLVNRDVIRVVTPGTVMENSMLDESKNNYICSLYIKDSTAWVCFCDISTGTMQTTVVEHGNFENDLKSELFKYSPKEIIINSRLLELKWLTEYIKNILQCSVELYDDSDYNDEDGKYEVLKKQMTADLQKTYGYSDAEAAHKASLTAYCFLLFVLIYFPCIATMAASKGETGSWKWAGFAAGYTTVLAWIVSALVFQIGSLL